MQIENLQEQVYKYHSSNKESVVYGYYKILLTW